MSVLPRPLARWEESLAVLDARLAVALGPMLHVLDDLLGRLDQHGGDDGEPDGYDGSTNRGDLGRLLMDEWLLAQEVPDEFVRRAAENELTYLRRAYRRETPHGRTVVVVDTGPEQWGAGRLVQLAALVVLHRRARAAGTELVLRVLPSGLSVEGELHQLLREWLLARSTGSPTLQQLESLLGTVDAHDRVWLLAGPSTRALLPSHRRTVSSRVSAWGAEGGTRVAVRVGDSTTELDLPASPVAVAALRGEGLLRRRTEPTVMTASGTGRGAVFGSADARLLWRGSEANEVYGCVLGNASGQSGRVKRYRMNGTVVAASSLGRRIVAAVTDGTGLWVQVLGKNLARSDRIHVPLSSLGLDQEYLDAVSDQPLPPLYLHGGDILVRGLESWCWLAEGTVADWRTVAAVAPGTALDDPRQAYVHGGVITVDGRRFPGTPVVGPVLGPPQDGGWCAWSEDTRIWRLANGREGRVVLEIAVDEGDRVLGLCVVDREPALVVVSASGRMLRQLTSRHVKTWTRWAGPAYFDLHPTRPWLARTTSDRITVGDLATGNTLLEIRTQE